MVFVTTFFSPSISWSYASLCTRAGPKNCCRKYLAYDTWRIWLKPNLPQRNSNEILYFLTKELIYNSLHQILCFWPTTSTYNIPQINSFTTDFTFAQPRIGGVSSRVIKSYSLLLIQVLVFTSVISFVYLAFGLWLSIAAFRSKAS